MDIEMSSDGLFVYVANNVDGTISQFHRDPNTGYLSPITSLGFTVKNICGSQVISNDNKSLYVLKTDLLDVSGSILQYDRDLNTGELILSRNIIQLSYNDYPNDLIISADGKFVYCITFKSIYLYKRDINNIYPFHGSLSFVDKINLNPGISNSILIISPDGLFAYLLLRDIHSIRQFSRDINSGILTQVGNDFLLLNQSLPSNIINNIKISSDGLFLYVLAIESNIGEVLVFSINSNSGVLTLMTSNPLIPFY